MLARVPHLVTVEPATAAEAADQNDRSAAVRTARRAGEAKRAGAQKESS